MSTATSTPSDKVTTAATAVLNILIDTDNTETHTGSTNFYIDDFTLLIFTVMNFVIILQIIDIFGAISNIINIIIFVKLGFKDPVNISLLGLAISDLGSCVTLFWMNICFNPLFQKLDLDFDPEEVQYLQSGWPHATFTRITSCITAFITFERCLCVVVPLKVKNIITPKRVTIFLVAIFVFIIGSISPVYYYTRYAYKYFPDRNKTLLGLVFTDDRDQVEPIAYAINSIVIPLTVFIIIVICTAVLVVSLKRKSKWRESAANVAGKANPMSSRDTKVSKMVVAISILFIVCFIPVFISFIGMVIFPEFSITGRYRNLNFIIFSYHFMLEASNSSFNIFIYYTMSTNYRVMFNTIFRRKSDVKDTS